jgi:hypothetical protein
MSESTDRPRITEADITARTPPRGHVMRRFGLAVATLGVAGVLQACGGGESGSAESSDNGAGSDAAPSSSVAPVAYAAPMPPTALTIPMRDPIAWLLGRSDSTSVLADQFRRAWVLARATDGWCGGAEGEATRRATAA